MLSIPENLKISPTLNKNNVNFFTQMQTEHDR